MLANLKTKWQSLIFRLLFYFLLALIALAIVLGISFTQRIKPHLENEILPNVERYIEYLIDDIGVPPDLAVAQRLADELPFELRLEGRGVDWSSSRNLRPISHYDFEAAPRPLGPASGSPGPFGAKRVSSTVRKSFVLKVPHRLSKPVRADRRLSGEEGGPAVQSRATT